MNSRSQFHINCPDLIFYTLNICQLNVYTCQNQHIKHAKNCLLESRMTLENNRIWIEDRMWCPLVRSWFNFRMSKRWAASPATMKVNTIQGNFETTKTCHRPSIFQPVLCMTGHQRRHFKSSAKFKAESNVDTLCSKVSVRSDTSEMWCHTIAQVTDVFNYFSWIINMLNLAFDSHQTKRPWYQPGSLIAFKRYCPSFHFKHIRIPLNRTARWESRILRVQHQRWTRTTPALKADGVSNAI